MNNIKVFVFDAFGTLFDVNSAAEQCSSVIGYEWKSFSNDWRVNQLEYTWLRSLMQRHKNFWQITKDSLDKSMKTYGIDKSKKNMLLDSYKALKVFSEVKEILNYLKNKKYKLTILSNGTYDLINNLVKSNDLSNLIDDVISIEDVQVYKPHPEVYKLPLQKYKINKNEILFLSSNTWDVSGAGNFGFDSVWINRNNLVFDNLDYKPKHEIKNLSELSNLIKI